MGTVTSGLLDTSVLIAAESGRSLDTEVLPAELAASIITLAELRTGVLTASSPAERATRLRSLENVTRMKIFEADDRAAAQWARLRVELRDRGRRMNVNDLWIAAIGVANGLPIVTQDADFDALIGIQGVELIRV
ncbi:PIN domain-containing protein [Microbacterium profundi]